MSEKRKALVVGATGLSGSHTAKLLVAQDWEVITLSRSTPAKKLGHRHIAVNLESESETTTALSEAADATHVFYCTWSRQRDEAASVAVNGAMMRNLFAGLTPAPLQHVALVTGLKHYLGSFDDYAASTPYTPFLENQPRLTGLNFYYEQEDVLFEAAASRKFRWSVHRPHTLIGFVLGNAMNMAVTLAVCASICRHTGRPFVFPGSPGQYRAVTDVTSADLLAEQLVWAATTPEAADKPFNVVNGDVFRWTWLWAQLAQYFGIEVAEYPGYPTPLEDQMADAPEIWREMVADYGLQDIPVSKLASWWHSDADLGREIECFTDMTNSRQLGFTGYRSTPRAFTDVFDALRADRVIPTF